MSTNLVYVVGGSGYLGSRLCPLLTAEGWDVVNYDAGIYGNVPARQKVDVLSEDFDIPGDMAPVVWLATIHREPDAFASFSAGQKKAWTEAMTHLMVKAPVDWIAAGHPMVYASSMQAHAAPHSAYGYAKGLFESAAVARQCRILRFGTVWGGLEYDPARPHTAVNRAILGAKLPETYISWVTHINRALAALAYALCMNFTGTVENMIDEEDPIAADRINGALETPPNRRTIWQMEFVREVSTVTEKRHAALKKVPHPIELLAKYYKLSLEAEIKDEKK